MYTAYMEYIISNNEVNVDACTLPARRQLNWLKL